MIKAKKRKHMKTTYSDMPIEIKTCIAYFLNPITIITLNKNFYLDLYSNAQYWEEITKRDFGWVLKEKPISAEEKNYLQLYKILTCYYRPFKHSEDKFPLSPKRLLPQLQKITLTLNAQFIPQWLNEQIFLESVIIHKHLAMDLYQLVIQYESLFQATQDHSTKTVYQKKAIRFGEMALKAGFDQKHSVAKETVISKLSNLNLKSGEQLFEFLEKHYQYNSIYYNESKFNIDLENLHEKWWNQMLISSDPQEKIQQIRALSVLYLRYQYYQIPLPGLSSQQLTERMTELDQLANSMNLKVADDSKGPALFNAASTRQRTPNHTRTEAASASSCLIS